MMTKRNGIHICLSILLTLAMVLGLLPAAAVQVYAEEENIVTAWMDTNDDGVIDEGETTYASLVTAFEEKAPVIKLADDVDGFACDLSDLTTILDLNGYQITLNGWFDTMKGACLTVKDSSEAKTGRIVCDVEADCYMDVYNGGTVTLEGGTIDALRLDDRISAVTLNGGTVSHMIVNEGAMILGDAAVTMWEIAGGSFNVDPATLPGFDSEACEVVYDEDAGLWTVEEADGGEEDDGSFAAVSAQYTDIHYEAEGEVVFASGTLQVTAEAAGTVTAAWGSEETLVEVTCAVEAGVSADLTFEAVELWDLRIAEITFVPDEDADAAATQSHYISDDLVTLDVAVATAYIEEVNGYYLSEVRINGIPASELYLFPGTQVTVELGLVSADAYQVGEILWSENGHPAGITDGTEGTFYYENEAEEKEYAEVTDDGRGTITFTLPAEMGSRAWLDAFCTHRECVDHDADHWCDSGICGKKTASVDTDSDHICDICGVKMAMLNGWASCDLEGLLNRAADGDTVTLLGDHAIHGEKGWHAAVFFDAGDDAVVTLDLNGFTLSVDEADYLLSVGGRGTVKIVDSSEQKTGRLSGGSVAVLDMGGSAIDRISGVIDLSEYPDASGLTVMNNQPVPAGVSGNSAESAPIRLILPEGYAVAVEIEGRTMCTKRIPAEAAATVVMPPALAPDGQGMVLRNAQVLAEKVLIAGYLDGQLKAVQAVDMVTEEIVITDEVLAYVNAAGGELRVFLLDGTYAPADRIIMPQ